MTVIVTRSQFSEGARAGLPAQFVVQFGFADSAVVKKWPFALGEASKPEVEWFGLRFNLPDLIPGDLSAPVLGILKADPRWLSACQPVRLIAQILFPISSHDSLLVVDTSVALYLNELARDLGVVNTITAAGIGSGIRN